MGGCCGLEKNNQVKSKDQLEADQKPSDSNLHLKSRVKSLEQIEQQINEYQNKKQQAMEVEEIPGFKKPSLEEQKKDQSQKSQGDSQRNMIEGDFDEIKKQRNSSSIEQNGLEFEDQEAELKMNQIQNYQKQEDDLERPNDESSSHEERFPENQENNNESEKPKKNFISHQKKKRRSDITDYQFENKHNQKVISPKKISEVEEDLSCMSEEDKKKKDQMRNKSYLRSSENKTQHPVSYISSTQYDDWRNMNDNQEKVAKEVSYISEINVKDDEEWYGVRKSQHCFAQLNVDITV